LGKFGKFWANRGQIFGKVGKLWANFGQIGDQIGQIFAQRVAVYFGQLLENYIQ
jgi:hypothetical protein